ncbi:hypothetical protein Scep_030406 [Stephania cephalantha]|uniref:Cyclin C-terminal domain-containing protein n=1 Tax=Stephania cephalantha TaxID=152367 RepID=A0AAP0DZI5_9MAGN
METPGKLDAISISEIIGCRNMPLRSCLQNVTGLRSSLWLQFKPQHIAAGAAYLAAKCLNLDLASNGRMWHEFQTTPSILQGAIDDEVACIVVRWWLPDRLIPDETQQQWTRRRDFDEARRRDGLLAKKTRGVGHGAGTPARRSGDSAAADYRRGRPLAATRRPREVVRLWGRRRAAAAATAELQQRRGRRFAGDGPSKGDRERAAAAAARRPERRHGRLDDGATPAAAAASGSDAGNGVEQRLDPRLDTTIVDKAS